ncbi:DUF2867 domain-containing protein [Parazoarcus communis]|nr:DUF2867 domain-containing protein [Parazoarcus communis]
MKPRDAGKLKRWAASSTRGDSRLMKNQPIETEAPVDSMIHKLVQGSYFHDAWSINAAEPSLDPLSQFLRVAKATPAWIDSAMKLRNRLVSLLGLKNLGGLSEIDSSKVATEYKPGDRVGIFTLIAKSETEILLGDSDKHLDVVVSLHHRQSRQSSQKIVTVTTVVKVHNWLGRIYMTPVRPAHRVIVQAMVRAIGNAA